MKLYLFLALIGIQSAFSFTTIKENLQTDHGVFEYEIHFDEEYQAYAHRTQRYIRTDLVKLINYFKYVPRDKTHFIINRDAQTANGMAQPIPTNIIRLYDFPPLDEGVLTLTDDWERILVVHEFMHIMHLDQTSGFLEVLRTIFGTIGKLGFLTPRWFSEGIATWAEGHFTNGGRPESPKIRDFVYQKLIDPDFCQNIGCFDAPRDYPHGSYSYFIGGMWMKYLETKKKGTVQCLIEANSDSVMIYLFSTFRECTGVSPAQSFDEFRVDYITNYQSSIKKVKTIEIPNFKNKVLSVRSQMYGHHLLYVYSSNRDQYLAYYNVKRKKVTKTLRFDEKIESIIIANKSVFVKVSAGLGYEKVRKLYQIKSGKKILMTDESHHYYFPLGKDLITFDYLDQTWAIKKNGKDISSLTHGKAFRSPQYLKGHVLFETDVKDHYEYALYSIEKNKFSSLPLKVNQWSYLGNQKNVFVFKNKKTSNIATVDPRNGKVLNQKSNGIDNVLAIAGYGQHLKFEKGGQVSLGRLKVQGKSKKLANAKPLKWKSIAKKKYKEDETYFYPRISHFLPKYWFIGYSSSDNLLAATASTAFVDPAMRNSLDLTVKYYFSESAARPKVQYTYDREHLIAGVGYDSSLSKNSVVNTVDEDQFGYVFYGHLFKGEKWAYFPVLYYLQSEENDFISKRTQKIPRIVQTLSYIAPRNDGWILDSSMSLWASYYLNNDYNNFPGIKTDLHTGLSLYDGHKLFLNTTYGRLINDDLRAGVIYGGGDESFHPVHGIAYSDIYGNDIFTANGEYEARLFWWSGGYNHQPLYIRDVRLFGGYDYVAADFIIVNDRIVRNDTATSIYGGLRFNTTLGHVANVDVDFLFYNVESAAQNESGFTINLKAGSF